MAEPGMKMVAKYGYEHGGGSSGKRKFLSFAEGAVFTLIKPGAKVIGSGPRIRDWLTRHPQGWWLAQSGDEAGYIPANHLVSGGGGAVRRRPP